MRKLKDTIPLDPSSLTECRPCEGRGHLRCDCPRQREVSDVPPRIDAKEFEARVLPHLPKLRIRARMFTRGPSEQNMAGWTAKRSHVWIEPEDLVQETLLRAWKAWGHVDVKEIWGWLWLTMRNVFLDGRAGERRWVDLLQSNTGEIGGVRAAPPPAPDAFLVSGLDDQTLAAVRQLPKAQRTVIEMQLMGIDIDTAAESLQIGRRSALVATRKARQRLRLTVAGG